MTNPAHKSAADWAEELDYSITERRMPLEQTEQVVREIMQQARNEALEELWQYLFDHGGIMKREGDAIRSLITGERKAGE